jgi:hypothetical protein
MSLFIGEARGDVDSGDESRGGGSQSIIDDVIKTGGRLSLVRSKGSSGVALCL